MLQITFFLRGSEAAKPSDYCIIYCQPAIDGGTRATPFTTRMRCRKMDWNGKEAFSSAPMASNINGHLMTIRKKLMDVWQMLGVLHPEEDHTIKMLMHYYKYGNSKPLKTEPPGLIKALDMMVAEKQIKTSTWNTYRTRKKNIVAYLKSVGQERISVDEIDKRFCHSLHAYLRNHGQSQNVANKHITLVRAVLEFCVDQKFIKSFPMGRANLKYTAPEEPKYLKAQHRNAIIKVNIKSLEKVRDTAVFLMYTGFSYTDYLSLTSKHLISSKGRRCFKKARNKTNIFSMPPLFPEAEEIILKYGSIENLPRIQIDDFNKLLKVLGELAGLTSDTIGFDLSTSVFRETFCSWCENEMMFSERVIMYFMGHTSRRQLNTYSNIQPSRIFREMEISEKYRKVG